MRLFLSGRTSTAKFDTTDEYFIDGSVDLAPNWTFGVDAVVRDAGKKNVKAYPVVRPRDQGLCSRWRRLAIPEPGHSTHTDLGLQLHWEGLVNLARERAQYTIEDVREAFEESKTERGI